MSEPLIATARQSFHRFLAEERCLISDNGIPSVADRGSKQSCAISIALFENLRATNTGTRPKGQSAGSIFETACAIFLEGTFLQLGHLRPGNWKVSKNADITQFDQYEHLLTLAQLASANSALAAAMVSDYLVKPDVVVSRSPVMESELNLNNWIADGRTSLYSPIRADNGARPLLHASVSCKWTIRSDRSQNTRSEALSLIRNRKGPLPHIVAVTAEPMPERIASIALGTGDMDCVYHFALPELECAVAEVGSVNSQELLSTMISGKLLRDIADLPLDLAI